MWHSLKYTTTGDNKLVYLAEPIPEIHDYNVEALKHTHNSKSEPEQDPLDITIRNSPALLKEPLAPETPVAPTPVTAATLDLKS